jgi:sulfite exporter TauE/SafE
MENIILALATGLTSGGISCFAVQGGFLTAFLAEKEGGIGFKSKTKALVVFLTSKLAAYTLLGLLLGLVGAGLNISPKTQGIFQIFIGLFMIATAGNLINLHPLFRYATIRPPKFIFKILRNQTKVKSFFTPALLGALTVFIPCGVTQAMMLSAVAAKDPVTSTAIMFAFIFGTIPAFLILGLATNQILKNKILSYVAALVIFVLGIISINSGQVLRGSVHTLPNYWALITGHEEKVVSANITSGIQNINIKVTNRGYQSDTNTIKLGVPVRLTIQNGNVIGCARVFTIPKLNYFKVIPLNGTEIVEFTPTELGQLIYTCSMGMYSGFFNVVQ